MLLQELIDAGRSEGERKNQIANILTLLEHKGTVPEALRSKIAEETDFGVLGSWFELAIETDSVEQFEEKIQ